MKKYLKQSGANQTLQGHENWVAKFALAARPNNVVPTPGRHTEIGLRPIDLHAEVWEFCHSREFSYK